MWQNLPLGTSDFKALRQAQQLYVDKTELVYRLASVPGGKYFLIRPRRFGKSLLVSTFESLFKSGLEDFQGLAIEKSWTDKTYDVVRLDFSEVKEFATIEEFKEKFYKRTASKLNSAGFPKLEKSDDFITQFSLWLSSLRRRSFVLLVDEYDAPLTACLDKKELFDRVRAVMSEFFLSIKSNEGCLRFFFVTGITKLSQTSIFSAFNSLEDISMISMYGTLLGYTEAEIKRYFADYLDNAAEILQISEKGVLDELRRHYDGFSFDAKAGSHVYCPWSVLNFLKHPEMGFRNYWYTSGGQPTVLMKFLANNALSDPKAYAESMEVRLSDLDAARQYGEMSLEVLLTQAGYFTIKQVTDDGYLILGYPNQEVALSMAQLYADELLRGQRIRKLGSPSLNEILETGSLDSVVEQFNSALEAIDYQRYPITDEASCRAYLQVLLIGAAMMPKVESHSALGRSDLEVYAGSRLWAFEIKYAKNKSDIKPLLHKAKEQMRSHRYGLTEQHREVLRAALVFDQDERRFVAWESV